MYMFIQGVSKVPGRLDNLKNTHHRKNDLDQSCRIFPGQFDGDLKFDLAHDFQGHFKVKSVFSNDTTPYF